MILLNQWSEVETFGLVEFVGTLTIISSVQQIQNKEGKAGDYVVLYYMLHCTKQREDGSEIMVADIPLYSNYMESIYLKHYG